VNEYDGWKARLIDALGGTKWAGKAHEMRAIPEVVARDKSPKKLGAAARVMLYNAFREDGDDDVKAYEKQLSYLDAAAANPDRVREGVKTWLGPTGQEYPQAVEHLTNKIVTAAKVLRSQAPTGSEPDGMMFGNWFKMPPDDTELERFEEVWTAVLKPRAVLSLAKADELSPDTVDVLDVVHPDLMADFRMELSTSLAQGNAPRDPERRRSLSILYRVPMDPTMEPEYIDMMQAMHGAREQITEQQKGQNQYRPRGTGRPSGVNISTNIDRIEEDRSELA